MSVIITFFIPVIMLDYLNCIVVGDMIHCRKFNGISSYVKAQTKWKTSSHEIKIELAVKTTNPLATAHGDIAFFLLFFKSILDSHHCKLKKMQIYCISRMYLTIENALKNL